MTNRRQASAVRRQAYHLKQIKTATTELARLWKACTWLTIEARRSGRLIETLNAVLDLVVRVRDGHALPDAPSGLEHVTADPNAPHVPWFARGDADSDTEPRRVA